MKASGYETRPDYRVDLLRRRNHFRVVAGGAIIADSDRAILVDEQDHAIIVYFPRADVAMDRLVPVAGRTTHCPYKGDAVYWALVDGGEPVAWSYPDPYAQVAAIRDHLAFYQDRVDVIVGAAKG